MIALWYYHCLVKPFCREHFPFVDAFWCCDCSSVVEAEWQRVVFQSRICTFVAGFCYTS